MQRGMRQWLNREQQIQTEIFHLQISSAMKETIRLYVENLTSDSFATPNVQAVPL